MLNARVEGVRKDVKAEPLGGFVGVKRVLRIPAELLSSIIGGGACDDD